MKKLMILMAMGSVLALGVGQARAEESGSRIGGGVNYWTTIDNVDVKDIDEHGLSYYVSYQYRGDLLGLEADVEFMPDSWGEDVIAPQAYLLIGGDIYAAAGVGILTGAPDDPMFYALRAGLDLELLPHINLDVYATYRFGDDIEFSDAIDNIDTDTLFLGAAVRLGL
jgi:hypothetical protein